MKKYIGIKEVKAEPMKLQAFIKETGRDPYQNDPHIGDEEGYLVEYEDGYCSWSPKDVFEKAYKVADTPQNRLVIEYNELLIKYNKLVLFLAQKDAEEIAGEYQVRLMREQLGTMHSYLNVLFRRIHPTSINKAR